MFKNNLPKNKYKNHSSNNNIVTYTNKYNNKKKHNIICNKSIMDNYKQKMLYKYIDKCKKQINKNYSNSNIKAYNCKTVKNMDNKFYESPNKRNNNIYNIIMSKTVKKNDCDSKDDINKSNLGNLFNNNTINNNTIYNINNNSCERKAKNICYCFPDNKFRKIRGLSKDHIIKNFESIKTIRFRNVKNKTVNRSVFNFTKLNNYLTYLSIFIKNNENKSDLSTDRMRKKKDIIQEKNKFENTAINAHNHQWVWFPIKIELYIHRINFINNGYFLFTNLKKINEAKKMILKKNKLLHLLNKKKIKLLKINFRKYRENVIIEKVRQIYENKNYRLRSTKKKSNNLQSRAKLFITKEKKSVKQIKPKYNKNKNNTLYKFKKSFEKLKLTIYKYHIYNYFIILKNKLLTPKHDAFYNKAIFNRKVYSAEINPRKKHIKIKYIKKKSKSTEKCDCSLSCKTSSSNSKSTLNTTKKMKVYKRTVFINAHNNNENIISELDDKIRNQFKLRLTNILFKICSDERKYFIKWKKQCINANN